MKPRKYIEGKMKSLGLEIVSLTYHPQRYYEEYACTWDCVFRLEGRTTNFGYEGNGDTSQEAAEKLLEYIEFDLDLQDAATPEAPNPENQGGGD